MTKTYRPIQEVVDEALADYTNEPEFETEMKDKEDYAGERITLIDIMNQWEDK